MTGKLKVVWEDAYWGGNEYREVATTEDGKGNFRTHFLWDDGKIIYRKNRLWMTINDEPTPVHAHPTNEWQAKAIAETWEGMTDEELLAGTYPLSKEDRLAMEARFPRPGFVVF